MANQPHNHPDRAACVAQIQAAHPTAAAALEQHADALAAAGLPWQTILQLMLQLLASLGPILKPPVTP